MDIKPTPDTDYSALVNVIGRRVYVTDTVACRVRWLLELGDALDSLNYDGVTDLATTARTQAIQLIKSRIDGVVAAARVGGETK